MTGDDVTGHGTTGDSATEGGVTGGGATRDDATGHGMTGGGLRETDPPHPRLPAAGGAPRPSAGHGAPPLAALSILLLGAASVVLLLTVGRLEPAAARAVAAGWAVLVLAAAVLAWRGERRRAERERRLAAGHRRLLQAQKMEAVGRLAGGIAHDVNNYLAVIRAHCELVLSKRLDGEPLRAKMELVIATVLKASSLVERLLTFSRRQPTRPAPVDLGEVVESFETVMRGSLPEGVELACRLDPDLWPVEVDLSQIEQVLANLFVNARDALPASGGRVVISSANRPGRGGPGETGETGDRVVLAVRDDGAGMPPEVVERIFDPFFTTKEGIGASGLGLATVYAAIEEAGGSVEVESAPGRGSTFRVVLPRGPARGAAAAGGSPAGRGGGELGELEGTERLLLVDDNTELAEAAASQLAALGYRVTTVADAEAASTAAREAAAEGDPFELAVCDVKLPGTTGPRLIARLRGEVPAGVVPLKALYMSGYTERIALRSGPGRDEAFFLKKPFSAEGLVRMVRALLDAGATD